VVSKKISGATVSPKPSRLKPGREVPDYLSKKDFSHEILERSFSISL
jgi:hypothetical protein